MSLKARTVAVLTGAVVATTLAAATATATTSNGNGSAHMGGQTPAHMVNMDADSLDEMDDMMADDVSVGEMHRDMAEAGMPHGRMHQVQGAPDR